MRAVLTASRSQKSAETSTRLTPEAARPHPADGVRQRREPSLVTRALDRLSRSGAIGRELAWHLERGRVNGMRALPTRTGLPGAQSEIEQRWDSYYRWIWESAASDVGAVVEDLTHSFLRLTKGRNTTTVWQSNVMLDNPVTLRLSLDKTVCARILSRGGIPVPDQYEFAASDPAEAMKRLGKGEETWVVKPASGTAGGKGVTCGVRNPDDFVRACVRARRWDRRLLMERQLVGEEYRLLFLDGELLDVIRRRPPHLVGDGLHTVKQLIASENDRRRSAGGRAGLPLLETDLDSVLALRARGLSLRDTPARAQAVPVKAAANLGGPCDAETVHDLPSDIVDRASLAARLLGIRLAGVDLIVPDLSTGTTESRGVVIEVNALPGLHYHYLVAEPARAIPVASLILERLLRRSDSETS